jgi:carbonic anhydrase/acetyltransferase-like protein (isoleucine patch superfamily)
MIRPSSVIALRESVPAIARAPDQIFISARDNACLMVFAKETGMPIYALDDWRPELPPEGQYWLAPNATLIGRVRLLPGASVWFGSVIRGDNDWITIGERTNIQDLATLHTDPGIALTLGADVSVGHGAIIHGATVGDNTIIGMGATLLNKSRIGRNSIVGANALIPEGKAFPDNSLIVGVPGKAIRTLSEADVPMLTLNATIYHERWQRYVVEMKEVG